MATWHRGTPNRTSSPRPMLAMVYTTPWRREVGVTMARERFERMDPEHRGLLRYATFT